MATRIKKQQQTVSKEVASSPQASTGVPKNEIPAALTPKPGRSITAGVSKRKKVPGVVKTIIKKALPLKPRGRKAKKPLLKINPKNLARTMLENGKEVDAKNLLLKNGVMGAKRGRKPKALVQIKEEAVDEELPPVLEPIFPQEENVEEKKTPRKGRKRQSKLSELVDIKKVKTEIKTEPVDEGQSNELLEGPVIEAPSPKVAKKPGRQRKPKADASSIEEVMNDLSFLIDGDQIKKEPDEDISEPTKSQTKKLTKKQRLENIENTLRKLDPADTTKIIDRLDLNVRNIKTESPMIKRRHSIEKFQIDSVDSSTEGLLPQLTLFNQLPRSISPRTSKRGIKFGMRRMPSPYSTRSDSPARILRNGKHRKLTEVSLLEGLEDPKRRRRVHSDLSGSETASKLSGCDSDSSFSDLASLHGSEKDRATPTKDNDDLSSLEVNPAATSGSTSQTIDKLIDTNSNVCADISNSIDLKSSKKLAVEENIPIEDTPSVKVPEKGIILDNMKQAFNEICDKIGPSKCEVSKFYGREDSKDKESQLVKYETKESIGKTESKETATEALSKLEDETLEEQELVKVLADVASKNLSEEFATEDKEESNKCTDSIVHISSNEQSSVKTTDKDKKEISSEQDSEKDDSLPIIENMSTAVLEPPNSDNLENLEPPILESSVPETNEATAAPKSDRRSSSNNDRNIGIAVVEKGNIVSFSIEHLSDDIEEHEQVSTNADVEPSKVEEVPSKVEEGPSKVEEGPSKVEAGPSKVEEGASNVEEESKDMETPPVEKVEEKMETEISQELVDEGEEERTENECDKASEDVKETVIDEKTAELVVEESPEEQAKKESILMALGLQSLRAMKQTKAPKGKAKASTSNYTGTLKTVIKINKKKGKNSFKMTLQKNKNKTDVEHENRDDAYKIMKEATASSGKHTKDSSDTAGAHRKSHYSNRSNMDGSSEHTSDGEPADLLHDKNQPEKDLVIPEKASSFSIHPERLCKDECSYCFGKFGLFDTPCHIAQMKSVERQNKILATEKHLTRDSCLCDACYRHVDRKSNSPSYINKSLKRNSLVAPGPRQNHCHVLGCNNVSTNILRRKWIIKMRKNICSVINIDLDNPGLHSIPICDEHFSALEHLMICAMCKRRLAKNHIHYLGPEVQELNEALKDEGIPLSLADKPVVCKLCKCFASLMLKDPEERPDNNANFFREYKKRLLHFNDIVPMDSAEADEPIVAPGKSDKKDCEKDLGKRKNRVRNSSNETVHSGKDGHDEKTDNNEEESNTRSRSRLPSSDTNNSQSANQSRAQSPEEVDEYAGVDYNTLIPAIALECPSDNEVKKDIPKKQKFVPNMDSVGSAIEISRTLNKVKDEKSRSNDLAAQKLVQNPSISLRPNYGNMNNDAWEDKSSSGRLVANPAISVRQLFPGEEELGLSANFDFNNVVERTPDGWDKCVATIQYDQETKVLWEELQKPYGNRSSFLRHLILLEKYFRNGDLVLSPNATHHAINYRESVQNRLRAFDNIPSNASVNPQQLVKVPCKQIRAKLSASNGLPPVTISQIGREYETRTSKAPITLQQLNQPPLLPTNTMLQNLSAKAKAPPGLISLQAGSYKSAAPKLPQSQKIKFPITKSWRPNLIPIDPSKKHERKPGLVQVISGGKPFHITLEDYKKMCAIKRSFEQKQRKQQELLRQQQSQSLLLNPNSLLKSAVPKKSLVISKTSGGTVIENKPVSSVSSTITSGSSMNDSSETILEKLDKQVERLGQQQDISISKAALALEKNPSVQIIPRIPKSLTVIPQTVRKSRPPSPILHITSKKSSSGSSTDNSQP